MGVIFVPVTGELYFSSKELGAYKVDVNLKDYDVESLIAKANKLPLQREDNTFTIVASRSHMSAETEGYIEKDARHTWRGKINIERKLFKTVYGSSGYCQLLPSFCAYYGVGYRSRAGYL